MSLSQSETPSPSLRVSIDALTGLRFFAASYIIIFHTGLAAATLQHHIPLLPRFLSNGYLAVTLFFVLSGFILAYNYRGRIAGTGKAFRFLEARLARIWPAYLFSLLCSCWPTSHIPPLKVALATIFMVQCWNPLHPEFGNSWNFVCWTLSVEIFFYLVFPFFQRIYEWASFKTTLLLGSATLLVAILANTPYHNDTSRYPGIFFFIIAPMIHLPEFLSGVLAGNLFHLYLRKKHALNLEASSRPKASRLQKLLFAPKGFHALTYPAGAASIINLCFAHANTEGLELFFFALFLLGLASESSRLSRFLSSRILVIGGEISYAMYLLRTPMQGWILALPPSHLASLLRALYIPILLIPFSLLTYYLIEGPARRFLRQTFSVLHDRLA